MEKILEKKGAKKRCQANVVPKKGARQIGGQIPGLKYYNYLFIISI